MNRIDIIEVDLIKFCNCLDMFVRFLIYDIGGIGEL